MTERFLDITRTRNALQQAVFKGQVLEIGVFSPRRYSYTRSTCMAASRRKGTLPVEPQRGRAGGSKPSTPSVGGVLRMCMHRARPRALRVATYSLMTPPHDRSSPGGERPAACTFACRPPPPPPTTVATILLPPVLAQLTAPPPPLPLWARPGEVPYSRAFPRALRAQLG